MIQKNKQFDPHMLVVPVGSMVQFPNHDPFFHNVFSLYNGKRFDLGLYETGSERGVRFDREGVSYIFCNIHPEMGAVILALSTPYYDMSADGAIVIPRVPPGKYTPERVVGDSHSGKHECRSQAGECEPGCVGPWRGPAGRYAQPHSSSRQQVWRLVSGNQGTQFSGLSILTPHRCKDHCQNRDVNP